MKASVQYHSGNKQRADNKTETGVRVQMVWDNGGLSEEVQQVTSRMDGDTDRD